MITKIGIRILFIKVALFLLVITNNFMKLEAFTFNMYSGRGLLPYYQVHLKNNLVLDVPAFQGTARGLMSLKEVVDPGNFLTLAFFTDRRAKTLCVDYSAESISLKELRFGDFTC